MPLDSRLPEIAAELQHVVDEALRAGAERVAESAKSRVPVRTGRLRDAIHVDTNGDETLVVAGDSKTWYGHIIEHGSVNQPAHPFLVPALEENQAAIVEDVRAALRRVVR